MFPPSKEMWQLPAPEEEQVAMSRTTREAAEYYLSRGWAVIPVPFREKAPTLKRWPDLRLTKDDLPRYFDEHPQNIGVLLGEPSGGLIDVDLDSPEALTLASRFLPPTECGFGRASTPESHWLYRVAPIPRSIQYRDLDGSVLLESRSTGCQTISPPSVHPEGEITEFFKDGEPASIEQAHLLSMTSRLAAASLLSRHWPREGSRQEAALALAGGLLRKGWDDETVAHFLKAIAFASRDEEITKRVSAGEYTRKRLDAERPATGWPHLAKLIDPDVVRRVREWTGPEDETKTPSPPTKTTDIFDISPAVISFEALTTLEITERLHYLPWLAPGTLVMVHGTRGVGKTMFQLGLAAALSTGTPFLKWPISIPVGVLYVDGEMRLEDLRARIMKLVPHSPEDKLHFLTSERVFDELERDLSLTREELREAVTRYLEKAGETIQVVILDNISSLFSGIDEDKKQAWEPINAWLIRLRHRGLAVILVHHSGKGGGQRGTSGREDALDIVIQLDKPVGHDARDGCHFELRFTKTRSVKGEEVAPLDVRLHDHGDRLEWVSGPIEESKEAAVERLLEEGVEGVTDIAERLGISKGYASKLKMRVEERKKGKGSA